jgi:DNA-binding LytR/AlgR family response regulator
MTNPSFNILIVEDELLIAELLKELLQDLNNTVVGIVKTYDAAVEVLRKKPEIDLVMLDINLNDHKNGIDLARYIEAQHAIPFIFLTSYSDQKTVEEAAELQPHAYLIKPFTQNDLFISLSLLKNRTKTNEKHVVIKDGFVTYRIRLKDILWIKSETIYIEIVTRTKKYLVRNSLLRFLEEYPDEQLFRAHKSYVVNLSCIEAVNAQHLIINGTQIPISRNSKKELQKRLKGS